MDRIDARLRELQQEQIETRNLTIKSDHAVRTLAGEIRELTRMQEEFQRRTVWSSAAAYVLFTVLLGGGLFLFFQATSNRDRLDDAFVEEQMSQLEGRIRELEDQLERRKEAEQEAWSFFELLEQGAREEVVERFPNLQGRLMDRASVELFRREVERFRQQLAADAWAEGMSAYHANRWADARDAFQRSRNYSEFTSYTAQLNYYLGDALFQLGDFTGAVRYYNVALASGDLTRDVEPLAIYRLGEALRSLGRDREAMDAYTTFIQRFPNHPWKSASETRAAALRGRLEGGQ